MGEKMEMIMFLIYLVIAYWAMHKIWWSRHTYIIHDWFKTFAWRIIVATCCGFVAIPVAIFVSVFGKKQG